jgi:hypothetical protein
MEVNVKVHPEIYATFESEAKLSGMSVENVLSEWISGIFSNLKFGGIDDV